MTYASLRRTSPCMASFGLLLATCVALTAGCSQRTRTARHAARADDYYQAGKFSAAVIEYRNVLRYDPANANAIRRIGLALCETGDLRGAIPYLRKAESTNPADPEIALKLGSLYLAAGNPEQARARAETVLGSDANNLNALMLWAQSATTTNEQADAITRLEAARAQHAADPRYHLALGIQYIRSGNRAAAEATYLKGIQAAPNAWELHTALAELYLARRDLSGAEREYRTAAAQAPPASISPVRLAAFLDAHGKSTEARKLLDDVLRQAPDFAPALTARADLAIREQDYPAAIELAQTLLKSAPRSPDAAVLPHRIELAMGKTDEAVAGLEKALSAYPTSATAHHFLGLAYLQKGNLPRAADELEKAVSLTPDNDDTVRALAELRILAGSPRQAADLLETYTERHADADRAFLLLGSAYEAQGDHARAEDTYRSLMKRSPDNASLYLLLGITLQRQHHDTEAAAMFEKALAIEPGFVDAVRQLAFLDAKRDKNWETAAARIRRAIGKAPDKAGLYYLLGSIETNRKNWEAAEQAMRKAIELQPDTSAAYLALSNIYRATGRNDAALAKIDEALARKPDAPESLMLKASLLQSMNNLEGAAAEYRRILESKPNFVPAMNNLAALYSEGLNREAEAYKLAMQARRLAPDDPAVADTLGTIALQRGDNEWALSLFKESARKLPHDARILKHIETAREALGNTNQTASATDTPPPGTASEMPAAK